ncbi:MAG: SIMPL domain-containing protein [Anaerolineae bacterium]
MKNKTLSIIVAGIAMLLLGVITLVGVPGIATVEADVLQQNETVPRTITVVGEGKASAPADVAVVYIGVQVSDPDVKVATDNASQQMEAVLTALEAAGIAANDIQTSYYNVYVDRPYGPEGPSSEAVYQVSNTMQVTVRDLENITEILGAAIEAGANSINSIEFRLSDPDALRSEARANAVANAEARAAEIAELNGLAVGEVLQVSEVVDSGAYFVSEQSYAAAVGMGGGGAGPISPGQVDVSAQLQIVYAIVR